MIRIEEPPQVDETAEPRWVTQTLRLFPHPVFAVGVSFACLLVVMIFTFGAFAGGAWAAGIVAAVFAAGAYIILAALVIRRRRRSDSARLEGFGHPALHSSLAVSDGLTGGAPSSSTNHDLSGVPPVATRNLLLYLCALLIWEAQITLSLLRLLNVMQLDAMWRHSLSVIHISVTCLAIKLGRHDIQRIRASHGKIELTASQVAIVSAIVVSMSVTGVILVDVLRGKL